MENIIEFLKTYSPLITVIGSLTVFFSWIIDNTLKKRFDELKSRIRRNTEENKMFGFLSELRDSLNSIASEIVQPKLRNRITKARESNSNKIKYEEAEYKYLKNVLLGHQFKELNEFCIRTNSLANTAFEKGEKTKKINQLAIEVSKKHEKLLALRLEAEKSINNFQEKEGENLDELVKVVDEYDKYLRKGLIPLTPNYFKKAVDLSNKINEQVNNEFNRISKWTKKFKKLRIYLYIIGTFLILISKYIESISK